jgi:hypothetical protein
MATIENVQSRPVTDDPHRLGGTAPKVNRSKRKRTEKEVEADQKLLGKLMSWLNQERDRQAENRVQMAIDEDYYDSKQWSDEEALELMQRGQAPLVFNQIKPTVNWLLGTERRSRFDGKVLPREASDEETAQVKTKLLKYLSDVNLAPFYRSEVWKACVVAGLGWMEDHISRDPEDELLSSGAVPWKQMYHDSLSIKPDLSDSRYLFRYRWLDLDQAIALIPDKENLLRAASQDAEMIETDEDDVYYMGARINTAMSGDYESTRRGRMMNGSVNTGRDRIKLIECWYRMPVNCKVCRAQGEYQHLNGEKYDPDDEEMLAAFEDGFISVTSHVKQEMRCAIMTESHLLFNGVSPYKHNRFPYTPMWAYRRHRDGMPYGVIRDIRDAQDDYNKRASKALFILSTVRVIMDDNAYEDVEELRQEMARPDAILTPKKGARFEVDQDKALADQHIKLMLMNGQMIRDVGGVTDQNLGKDDKGLSGQAIGKLQDQGSIITAALFDNMRLAIQLQNQLELSLCEQFYTQEKVIRIVGEAKPIEWIPINQKDPATGRILNDITASKADYVVAEQDFKASIRQAMFESMLELIGKLPPAVGLQLLDMVIDFADVPNKEELVSRIRKINGQTDPNRKPTPDEIAGQQAKEQKAAELEQLNADMLRADVEKSRAQAQEMLARIDKTHADIQKTVATAIKEGVTAAYEALQAAQIVATVPGVTPIADAVLAGAGYVDNQGQDPNIPGPGGTLPAMTPQPAHGSYVGEAAPGAIPELQQTDGAAAGIETMTPEDGIQQ